MINTAHKVVQKYLEIQCKEVTMGKCAVVLVKTAAKLKANKCKAQRLRQLARKRKDIGRIKRIKDRRGGSANDFEYLVEWQDATDDSWHATQFLPDECIQKFKDECVKFVVRRHKWQTALFQN